MKNGHKSLKISKLVEFDEALAEIDVFLVIYAERDDILGINGESIWYLFITPEGCAQFLDHTLSEVTLLVELGYGHVRVIFLFAVDNTSLHLMRFICIRIILVCDG